MPFIPDDDALRLAVNNGMVEERRPFLLIRDRSHTIPSNDDIDGCIPFDEVEPDLDWLDRDTLDELHTVGHAIFRPATPVGPLFEGTINRARYRQVCISSYLLAAAPARANTVPEDELAIQASIGWLAEAARFDLGGLTPNLFQSKNDFGHPATGDDCWQASIVANLVNYDVIYPLGFQTGFWSGRLHSAAVSAVEAVTQEYGDAAAPLQEFLPRQNAQSMLFRAVLLRAFHGNHNCAWHVTSLAPLSPALRVVIALGRLARDRKVPLTAGLVRDVGRLREPYPWIANFDGDQEDMHQLYIVIARFVEDLIGADELANLAQQAPALIPDHVWAPPRPLPLLPELKFDWL